MPTTARDYGYVDSFLNANPEIKALVAKAVKDGWTPEQFQMRLKDTKWYRTRSEAQRQFDTIKTNDPGEYTRRVDSRLSQLTQMAAQMGVTLTGDMRAHAATLERSGMSEDEMRVYVASRGTFSLESTTGLASVSVDQLRKMASDYGVPTADNTLAAQARQIMSGAASAQTLEDYYREQAKRQYTSIADQLDAGLTVRDVAQPYLDLAAEELGESSATMDLRDSKWTTMFQGEKTMTYDEFKATVRTDPRYNWINSTKATQEAASLATAIGQRFGAMA